MHFPVFQHSIILLKLGHCFDLHPCPTTSTDASCKAEPFSCAIQECVDKLALKNFLICLREWWCIKIQCFVMWPAQSDLASPLVIAWVHKSLPLVIITHKYVHTNLQILCVCVCVSWDFLRRNNTVINQTGNRGLCSLSDGLFPGVKK